MAKKQNFVLCPKLASIRPSLRAVTAFDLPVRLRRNLPGLFAAMLFQASGFQDFKCVGHHFRVAADHEVRGFGI